MLIGRRISGRYKILRMIGGGGMANVYLALDMILEREVAVKILRLDFANEDEFIRRFQREAQSATSLTHPNIVSIYDVGEEGDIYYIVMEYVDGMTLKQFIQQYHPIPIEKSLDIMKQLTSAVAHAHENHIVHRDIKPQNILIDHHGQVMITDFGIAMALSATSITQTNAVLGSVHYLSPEQARGGMATEKSDIYSLGIVMFELFTGRLPFSGESAVSIALKHLQSDTPSPTRWNPDIPQSVENIVLKATAKDPFLRYNAAEEMEEDLETALDPERQNDPKFTIPEDVDATRAIPVITNSHLHSASHDTVLHTKEKEKPSGAKKQPPTKKKRKKWPWLVGIFMTLLLLAVVFFSFILPAIRDAQIVVVPDLSEYEYDEAVMKLSELGLKLGENHDIIHEEIPEGSVVKTEPKANEEVKKGSSVDIYVSSGKEKFPLADYTGRQFDSVVSILDPVKFKSIKKDARYDDSAVGTILEQNHEPGEVVPGETDLVFVVSLGPKKMTLRNLSGYNADALESYEESTGFEIVIAGEEYSDSVAAGLVISQTPAPGTELINGDKVTVILSKGQEEIPPQTKVVSITIPYEPAEEGMEQEVSIFVQDMHHSITTPVKTFTITETVTEEIELTIEKGKKASYQVIRDNSVLINEEVEYSGE
ncbi:Stk1 family PASTA domain-containing Ser/Thr kinase [Bacillus sp. FJAT-50079]|uniref:Stk1 family PASTA domain-containing Ser/Thr kinase n=1 Tax=Bacillus sp. FJAT-50079 TaxID=2833577 RepID=UPI001BC96888|nr:Stk1 family PASTA domain-containing Ser/Thr kinase [Bacillus sp. FJAT-50079]MBS4207669.1 Stk1 family PASTA domain-containing Ser/Thr kinase [Bacillus sp. FJAT-50079]